MAFFNQYDTDVTVWSPQGRLHQVEYAMEVVNQVSRHVFSKRALQGCSDDMVPSYQLFLGLHLIICVSYASTNLPYSFTFAQILFYDYALARHYGFCSYPLHHRELLASACEVRHTWFLRV